MVDTKNIANSDQGFGKLIADVGSDKILKVSDYKDLIKSNSQEKLGLVLARVALAIKMYSLFMVRLRIAAVSLLNIMMLRISRHSHQLNLRLLVLNNGDKIPADCVIIESNSIRVNESSLTGESVEVAKSQMTNGSEIQDLNMLFMVTLS